MNLERFLNEYSIPFQVEGRRGWISLACPFCDDRSKNLGYNIEKDFFTCWRCGHHRVLDTVCRLANVTTQAGAELLRRYTDEFKPAAAEVIRFGEKKAFKYPSGVGDLQANHKKYLRSRGFDPDRMVAEWRLMGTGPASVLDGINFSHRIVIPIQWQERVVSFQTRDVTGKHNLRYMACPKDRELVLHQSIIYSHPECDMDDWVLVVEGVTDVWRLGRQAIATFGISISAEQIRTIANFFKKVIIVFDRETQAQASARSLMGELRFRGVKCKQQYLPPGIKDPAILSDEQAKTFLAETLYRSPASGDVFPARSIQR